MPEPNSTTIGILAGTGIGLTGTVMGAPGDTSAHTYALKNNTGLPRTITNRSIVVATHKR
jgi:hypothetical protein